MKKRMLTLVLLVCTIIHIAPFRVESASVIRLVGYLPDWAYSVYKNIDFEALTHLNIAFCNPDKNGNISCSIPDMELENIICKAHENNVKVMAALGGAGGCDGYLPLINNSNRMNDFNKKIMDYCEKYDFDGIDLDLELNSGHEIWNYYGDWVNSLRNLCDERGFELSTASARWLGVKVSADTFSKFDFINVMAYDNDLSKISHADMSYALELLDYFHKQKNISKDKLVLGVPFYGRGYNADGSLDWNSYMPFSKIIASDPQNFYADNYNGIAYNGAALIAEKCALSKEYGGIMIWELTQDAAGEYSLLKLIKEKLALRRLIGDVNNDGELSAADLVVLSKWLHGCGELVNAQLADINGDNAVNIYDLVFLRGILINKV